MGRSLKGSQMGGTCGLPVWPRQRPIKEGRSREHAGWPAGGLWGQPEEAVFKRTEGKEKDIPRPWVGMA